MVVRIQSLGRDRYEPLTNEIRTTIRKHRQVGDNIAKAPKFYHKRSIPTLDSVSNEHLDNDSWIIKPRRVRETLS